MTLPAHVRKLLDAVYGARWGEAYFEWGTFPTDHKLSINGKGRAADVVPPDDQAVFWTAGLLKPGLGRAAANVETVKVIVADDVGTSAKSKLDPDFLGMVMPPPTIPIQSSPGNFQWQWCMSDGMDVLTYEAFRRGLPFKSDATSAANLIRLPMGVSGKPGVKWRVTGSALGVVYTAKDLIAKCGGLTVTPASVARGSEALKAPGLYAVEAALAALPNDGASAYCKGHGDWITFGMALYGATGGEGLALWQEWNKGQPQERDLEYVWNSFHSTGLGWVKLRYLATEYGRAAFEAAIAAAAPGTFDDNAGPPPDAAAVVNVLALQRDVADYIAMVHGDRLRWNVSTSMWHRFEGTWRESPFDLGYTLAKRWADGAVANLSPANRKAVSVSGFYEGVAKILRVLLGVTKTDFDQDNWLLGTPGGTVELRTGRLRASVASEMISLSCAVTPSAGEDCPRWLKFVDWACTNPATGRVDLGMRRMLRQWAGYCLTGDIRNELVMFFHGMGANGKGTFIETMQHVMGDYFHLAAKDLFMATKFGTHTEDIAALAGKRMVVADEVPTNAKWNESLLKAVSGGGGMTSRHLYGRNFTFPIRFKVTIIGNEKPTFQGTINEALKRRLRLVEFRMTAKPIDTGLKKALQAEGAGILRWALGGLADFVGGGNVVFVADSAITATDDYFNENDLFGQWLQERTEVTPGKNGRVSDVFRDWEAWRNYQGNHELINSHKKLKEEMTKRGYVWRETKIGNVYNNLSVKNDPFNE